MTTLCYHYIIQKSKIESSDHFMNKLYNNKEQISTNLQEFFKRINLPLPEYRYNLLSELIISSILAESGVISDITKKSFSFH